MTRPPRLGRRPAHNPRRLPPRQREPTPKFKFAPKQPSKKTTPPINSPSRHPSQPVPSHRHQPVTLPHDPSHPTGPATGPPPDNRPAPAAAANCSEATFKPAQIGAPSGPAWIPFSSQARHKSAHSLPSRPRCPPQSQLRGHELAHTRSHPDNSNFFVGL
jgi:hypothetical protein